MSYRVVRRDGITSALPSEFNVALHRPTGDRLLASDRPREWWKQHGRDGSREFVCVECQEAGHPEPWLLYAAGLERQPHLKHFPSVAGGEPVADHSGETVWHVSAKRRIQQWALAQPGVTSAALEVRFGNRRPDVLVDCEAAQVAFELQWSPLDPLLWQERQSDIEQAGAQVNWLFATTNAPDLELGTTMSPQKCLLFDLDKDEVGVLVVAAAWRPQDWWVGARKDLRIYVDHLPRAGEQWDTVRFVPLSECSLGPSGIMLPRSAVPSGDVGTMEEERFRKQAEMRAADGARRKAMEEARSRPANAWAATSPPGSNVGEHPGGRRNVGKKRCRKCGFPMDPDVYADADEHMPEMNCHRRW